MFDMSYEITQKMRDGFPLEAQAVIRLLLREIAGLKAEVLSLGSEVRRRRIRRCRRALSIRMPIVSKHGRSRRRNRVDNRAIPGLRDP
jgi:hypothetical protein